MRTGFVSSFGAAFLLALVAASPARAATVTVTLVPSADVVGSTTTVSFGLPLPPGVVQSIYTISVTAPNGTLLPISARSLGTWKRFPPASLECSGLPTASAPGIRSALIQFPYRFTSTDPVSVTVDTAARARPWMLKEVPVRSTWHLVTDGTYSASDGVFEPSVYALLPPNWLACSNLTTMATESGTTDASKIASNQP